MHTGTAKANSCVVFAQMAIKVISISIHSVIGAVCADKKKTQNGSMLNSALKVSSNLIAQICLNSH